jgi:hypothetical protein
MWLPSLPIDSTQQCHPHRSSNTADPPPSSNYSPNTSRWPAPSSTTASAPQATGCTPRPGTPARSTPSPKSSAYCPRPLDRPHRLRHRPTRGRPRRRAPGRRRRRPGLDT